MRHFKKKTLARRCLGPFLKRISRIFGSPAEALQQPLDYLENRIRQSDSIRGRTCPMKTYTTAALTGSERFHLLTLQLLADVESAHWRSKMRFYSILYARYQYKSWNPWDSGSLQLLVLSPRQGPIPAVIHVPCANIQERYYLTTPHMIRNTLEITPLKTILQRVYRKKSNFSDQTFPTKPFLSGISQIDVCFAVTTYYMYFLVGCWHGTCSKCEESNFFGTFWTKIILRQLQLQLACQHPLAALTWKIDVSDH